MNKRAKKRSSNSFCSPRSMDSFWIVQLCCTMCITLCTICKTVHVNVDAAEMVCCFLYLLFNFKTQIIFIVARRL